ncbi:MAG: ketopantoate reductase C-terminal domain-containing protein, partial [Prevotella sp.]|nr:ketopantoate reductase C-terminal domain-containing protein [Prevotella sp.]MDY4625190.1 ketopantoate reductase C-terminal domain-containing protein [Prevotella sp.]
QMLEVIAAAKALGVKQISDSYADDVMDMTRKMKPYSPSMKLDYEFHRPMEIYYLYTRPIAIARSAGVDMPLMQALEDKLSSMDAANHG